MATREINRAAWAETVASLLAEEADGNKTAFGSAVGVDRKTVNRWLTQGVAVSEENVRAVARAFKLSAIDLLIRVGYYRPGELSPGPVEVVMPPAVSDDKPMEMVGNAPVPPSVKREMAEYVARKRAEHDAALMVELMRWIHLERRARRTS